MVTRIIRKCSEEQCHVDTDGVCYEGVPNPPDCKFYNKDYENEEENNQAEIGEAKSKRTRPAKAIEEEPSGYIHIHPASEFEEEAAYEITRESRTRIIVLIGDFKSGKTTLLATLYELFQEGPIGDYIFARSFSLHAFDRRCHFSRTASKSPKIDTEHTSVAAGQKMLHLAVKDKDCLSPRIELLFPDIAGEYYSRAKSSRVQCKQIPIIKRADHLVLLVNGEKIKDPALRNKEREDVMLMLDALVDAEMLSPQVFLDILCTKDDMLRIDPNSDKIDTFLNNMQTRVTEQFKVKVANIRFMRVSARTEEGELNASKNIQELFASWVENWLGIGKLNQESLCVTSNRQFDKFAYKQLPEEFSKST